MKFDTLIIAMVCFMIGFLFLLSKDYEKNGSFLDTVQITLGIKEPDNSPSPESTLVAPFAEGNVKPITNIKEQEKVSLPVNKIPMDKPHRSVRYIAEWLTQNVGNSLTLDKEKISKLNTEIAPFFTPEALEEYKNFGKNTNVFSAVYHGEDTTLSSYLKEPPLIMTSGPDSQGIYEWTYEILIVMNLVKGKLKQYKNTASEQQQKEIFFCISVKRNNAASEDGLLISKWKTGRCN